MKINFQSPAINVSAVNDNGELVYAYKANEVTVDLDIIVLLDALGALQQKIVAATHPNTPPNFK